MTKTIFSYIKLLLLYFFVFIIIPSAYAETDSKIAEIEKEAKEEAKIAEDEANANLGEEAEPKTVDPDPKEVLTRKLTELTTQLNNPDLSEAEAEIVFKELQLTRNAAKKIAPEAKPRKTDTQKQIETTVGITKPEPVVIKNPQQALKEQIQQHYKTLEKGVRKGQKMTNENLSKFAAEFKPYAELVRVLEKIFSTIKISDCSFYNKIPCWDWQGKPDANGYGRLVNCLTNTGYAHRAIYQILVQPISDLVVCDHLCKNRICVNPAHIEVVSSAENGKRKINQNAKKTHCKRGHQFNFENTIIRYSKYGRFMSRDCRTCYQSKLEKKRTITVANASM